MTTVGIEVAAARAVISTTLNIVINKLAPPAIKWYSSVVGVAEDLHELLDLVQEINRWLETTGYEAMVNDSSFSWLKRLKEVAYDVDDVVNEFQMKAEKHAAAAGVDIMPESITTPKSFIFRCKAANKINKLKKRMAAVLKQRTDYTAVTNSISSVDPPVRDTGMRTEDMSSWPDVDVASVVGRDEDKEQIISKLEETDGQQKIKIISIVGLGGSGKTTLAKLVFNDGNIKKNFDVTLWVHVSHEFDVDKLVKKLFESFADNNPGHYGMPYMRKTILEKLIRKRFLLVLDDVWTESRFQWENFREFFINIGAPGSRILLTTRSSKVAEMVGSTCPFELPLLSEASSWQLFIESFGMAESGLEPEFLKVGKEIVYKCGGLPLAIKVLAGVLRDKKLTEEWEDTRDNNLLDVEGKANRVFACLRLSYFHLPSHLKQCFTICSIFPKGHMIDKEQLIDQWIAHDMIALEDGVDYLEYVGHRYFNSLVQMSFLQNVEEVDGRVRCRMHDLVHDLALSILGDEISLVVPNEATSTTKSYRFISLNESKHPVPKNIFMKARAVYVTTCPDYIYGVPLKRAMHLRSITVGPLYTKAVPNSMFQVKYLKYLAMSRLECETLPGAISDVWSLQALHVTHSSFLELPESIGKLKKLRTLNLSGCEYLKSLPESIGDCKMISSIDLCNCEELTVLPESIGKLLNLRRLNLSRCKVLKRLPYCIGDCQMISSIDLRNCKELTMLPKSIGKLQKLRTLNLSQCEGIKNIPDSIGDCHMISSIDFCNCMELTMLPNSIGKLQKLITLNLSWCRGLQCLPDSIGDCPMISSIDLYRCNKLTMLPNSIGRNKNLRVLRLGYTKIKRLPSSIITLRNLECLDLQECWELVELPEGISNLEKLEVLNLKNCTNLVGMPLGLGKLSRLQKLCLFVVGDGKKFAGISELANISIGEELCIRGMSHQMDLDDAHNASLKQKTNLKRLDLQWMAHDASEVNIELEQSVLDGLEPPSMIKKLEIRGYLGREYARWMQNQVGDGVKGLPYFPFLRVMDLFDFPNLKHLHGLTELPCLKQLVLAKMPFLESISGGPFPSLVKLVMDGLFSLGEVWMVAERAIPNGEEGTSYRNFAPYFGQVRVGNCVSYLSIFDCPKLKVKPYLPLSLQYLQLYRCSEQLLQSPCQCQGSSLSPSYSHLKKLELEGMTILGSRDGWELLQHMTTLKSLEIRYSDVLTRLPESLGSLKSLRSLDIYSCSGIHMLPESVGQLQSLQKLTIRCCGSLTTFPRSTGHLTSLQELLIRSCDALHKLPECLGELCSLRKLEIEGLPRLTCLPQSMCGLASLQELWIDNCPGIKSFPQGIKCLVSLKRLLVYGCPGIKSLPEGIKGLTSLMCLEIWRCPDLQRRCERGKGEDWHLISHIPLIYCFGN